MHNIEYFKKVINDNLTTRMITGFEIYKGEGDPDRFAAQDRNAKRLCNVINNNKKYDGSFVALTCAEYYKLTTGRDFNELSIREKANFDSSNGDIIFVDNAKNALCKVDLKTGTQYLGSVSLGSIVKFDENGLYVCCSIYNGKYAIVSHEYVKTLALSGKLLPPSVKHKYKGYPVEFAGRHLTSEYWVSGNNFENYIHEC